MSDHKINMLSPEEIAELADIRRKMEELQARYDALVARAHPLGRPGLGSGAEVPSAVVSPAPSSSSPAAPAPVAAVPAAVGTLTATAQAPASSPKPLAGMKLSEAVITVLRNAGQPLPFEVIFQRLQEGGAALPTEKPMLAVRQVLYNQKLFTVERNRFRLANP